MVASAHSIGSVAYERYPLDSADETNRSTNIFLLLPVEFSLPERPAQQSVSQAWQKAVEMAEIHRLIEQHGKAGVLAMDLDRRVVEAAVGYMGSEESEIGFLYSGWAQTAPQEVAR
jgi:hypothetical protein